MECHILAKAPAREPTLSVTFMKKPDMNKLLTCMQATVIWIYQYGGCSYNNFPCLQLMKLKEKKNYDPEHSC